MSLVLYTREVVRNHISWIPLLKKAILVQFLQ